MKILAISLPVFQNKGSITKFSQKLVLAHVIWLMLLLIYLSSVAYEQLQQMCNKLHCARVAATTVTVRSSKSYSMAFVDGHLIPASF